MEPSQSKFLSGLERYHFEACRLNRGHDKGVGPNYHKSDGEPSHRPQAVDGRGRNICKRSTEQVSQDGVDLRMWVAIHRENETSTWSSVRYWRAGKPFVEQTERKHFSSTQSRCRIHRMHLLSSTYSSVADSPKGSKTKQNDILGSTTERKGQRLRDGGLLRWFLLLLLTARSGG